MYVSVCVVCACVCVRVYLVIFNAGGQGLQYARPPPLSHPPPPMCLCVCVRVYMKGREVCVGCKVCDTCHLSPQTSTVSPQKSPMSPQKSRMRGQREVCVTCHPLSELPQNSCLPPRPPNIYLYIRVYAYVHIHLHVHTYTYMCIEVHVLLARVLLQVSWYVSFDVLARPHMECTSHQ